jgi:LmbE family N-acetylglucosaminyl deacetylase
VDEQGSVERVLAIMAHPDDVDFGSAGTVAQWVKAGISVTYGIVTDGDAGGFDPAIPRSEIPTIRRAEQRAAAAEIGVSDVHFLGYKDGDVTVSQDLRRDISRLIRQVRPQRMLIQSPDRNWDRIPASHPDHLATGEAAIRAIYPDARNPFAHPELLQDEGLQDWVVPEVWLMASPTPNHYVDVTETFPDKMRAIHAHVSQLPAPDAVEDRVRTWLSAAAYEAGLPEGRLAESFQIVNIP